VRCTVRGAGVAGGLVLLAASAVPAAAQQPLGRLSLASNVAQVQLVVVVAPRVTLGSPSAIRELDRTPSTRLLAAPLGVRVNAPHRLLIQRVPDSCPSAEGTARRVAVRMPDGAFAEVTERPVAIARGAVRETAPVAEVLEYQVSASTAACDLPLPVSYEIEVAPTL
jgi:hypothetical protein